MYLVNINGRAVCVAGHYPLAPEQVGNIISCPACNVGLPAAMRSLANFMVWVEMEALFQTGHSLVFRDDHVVDAILAGKLRLEYP